MNQRSSIEEALKHFNMEECKPVGPPFEMNSNLLKLSNEKFGNVQREMEGVPYKVGLGSLLYAIVAMRANIAFEVSTMSQFMLKASQPHSMAVNRIMRYFEGTLDFKSCLGGKNIVLGGFCNGDWARDANY